MDVKLNRRLEGRYLNETLKEEYKSFSPTLINRSFEWKDKQINILLEATVLELGQLNTYNHLFPNIDQHIPLFVAREVIASNHLEGINSPLSHAFTQPLLQSEKQKRAWMELNNYIRAINWAVQELKRYPLSVRLVKQTHKILFEGLPDEKHKPGRIRTGSPRDRLKNFESDVRYIPPKRNEMKRLINDGKKFWRNEDLELPHLIKMAISLYQFENVLPFLNGNGRTVRTLMILELLSLKYLEKPIFCLSVFFERNRMEYYHRLNQVRARNDLEQWIRFFLNGIRETAKESQQILNQIKSLDGEYQQRITSQLGKKRHQSSIQLLDALYQRPFTSVNDIAETLDISFQSANQMVREWERIGLIKEMEGAKRNRTFYLWEYLELFEA